MGGRPSPEEQSNGGSSRAIQPKNEQDDGLEGRGLGQRQETIAVNSRLQDYGGE